MKLIANRPDPLGFRCKPFLPRQLESTLSLHIISPAPLSKTASSHKVLLAFLSSNLITGHDIKIFIPGTICSINDFKQQISLNISFADLKGASLEPMCMKILLGLFLSNGRR